MRFFCAVGEYFQLIKGWGPRINVLLGCLCAMELKTGPQGSKGAPTEMHHNGNLFVFFKFKFFWGDKNTSRRGTKSSLHNSTFIGAFSHPEILVYLSPSRGGESVVRDRGYSDLTPAIAGVRTQQWQGGVIPAHLGLYCLAVTNFS